MDSDQKDPARVRLPGHDRPHYGDSWRDDGDSWRDDRGAREYGLRGTRRVSNWTAAALIAGVAATTGYLAHEIPAGGTGGGTPAVTPAGKSAVTPPAAPSTPKPVVTSGGSGATGGGGDD